MTNYFFLQRDPDIERVNKYSSQRCALVMGIAHVKRCFGCSSVDVDEPTRSILEEFGLTGYVVNTRPTGIRIGESPFGIVDEVNW